MSPHPCAPLPAVSQSGLLDRAFSKQGHGAFRFLVTIPRIHAREIMDRGVVAGKRCYKLRTPNNPNNAMQFLFERTEKVGYIVVDFSPLAAGRETRVTNGEECSTSPLTRVTTHIFIPARCPAASVAMAGNGRFFLLNTAPPRTAAIDRKSVLKLIFPTIGISLTQWQSARSASVICAEWM